VFFLAQAFGNLAGSALAPLAPFLISELGLSRSNIGLFSSFLYLGALISGIPAGWLADRWGVKKTLMLGGILTGFLLGAVAGISTYWTMLLLVLLGGLGYGIINPVTSKGIVDWFEPGFRGTAMAIKQTGFSFGGILAAAMLPAIAVASSWRWSVAATGLIMITASFLFYIIYHDQPTTGKTNRPAGKEKTRSNSWSLLKDKNILSVSIIGIFFAAVQIAGSTYLVLYLVEKFSYPEVVAGGLLALSQGGGAAGRLFWGWASDALFAGNRKTAVVTVGITGALTTILLGLLHGNPPFLLMAAMAFLFGFTAVGYNAAYLAMVSELTNKETAGMAIGIFISIAYWGVFIGPPVFGLIVDKSNSYTAAWAGFGIALALASVVLSRIPLVLSDQKAPSTPQLASKSSS